MTSETVDQTADLRVSPADARPLIEVREPQGLLPDPDRPLPAPGRRGAGRRRHQLRDPQGRDARPGGRVRLRQEHHRPGADPAARRDRRHGQLRWRGPHDRVEERAAQDAPPDADHLPGSLLLPQSAHDRRLDHRRAARDPSPGQRQGKGRARPRAAHAWSGSTRTTPTATRTSSAAASASASAWPAPWRSSRSSSSATSRSARSTSRSRPRSSTCSWSCASSSA